MTMYDKRTRLEKAIEIIQSGKISILSKDIYLIESSSGENITVNLKDLTCRFLNGSECPDLKFNCDIALNQRCKHLLAGELYQSQKVVIQ